MGTRAPSHPLRWTLLSLVLTGCGEATDDAQSRRVAVPASDDSARSNAPKPEGPTLPPRRIATH
jgi:hypothetical protein